MNFHSSDAANRLRLTRYACGAVAVLEFVARRGDLEDDGFADGVDVELTTSGR